MQLEYAIIFCEDAWVRNRPEHAVQTYFAATELRVISHVHTDALLCPLDFKTL